MQQAQGSAPKPTRSKYASVQEAAKDLLFDLSDGGCVHSLPLPPPLFPLHLPNASGRSPTLSSRLQAFLHFTWGRR
jgi:hypothetical protein